MNLRHKSLAVHTGICQHQPQPPWGQHRAACKGLAPDTELTKYPNDLPWQKQEMQLQFWAVNPGKRKDVHQGQRQTVTP